MRRRKRYGLIMVPLIIAVIGLSIGFAAFSDTLTIKSTAMVNPNSSDFRLVFANNTNVNNLDTTSPVEPVDDNILGVNATINNTGNPTLTGLRANFTAPNQSVSYKVYVVNTGKYTAYLTNIDFEPVIGGSFKYCSGSQVTASLREAACQDISVSVTVGGTNGVGGSTYSSGSNEISNKSIAPNGNMEVYVTISYANNGHSVDGSMIVLFGDIILQYRTLNTPTPIVVDNEIQTPELEYLVDDQGIILGYYGDDTDLVIPNSLPLYVMGDEVFYYDLCVYGLTMMNGGDSNQAQADCTTYRNDFKQNGSNSATYDMLKEYTIIAPELIPTGVNVTVTGIADNVFYEADLTSVTLPNTLETIGNMAFMYNELQSINIPNSVKSIGYSAFGFNNLTSVTIGTGITSIGHGAFSSGTDDGYGPNALTSVSINVACDTYQAPFTSGNQFGWANNYSNSNIAWGTACSS